MFGRDEKPDGGFGDAKAIPLTSPEAMAMIIMDEKTPEEMRAALLSSMETFVKMASVATALIFALGEEFGITKNPPYGLEAEEVSPATILRGMADSYEEAVTEENWDALKEEFRKAVVTLNLSDDIAAAENMPEELFVDDILGENKED